VTRGYVEAYGDGAADSFKASKKWLQRFAKRRSVSLKRKSNKKSISALERLPKLRRWFARFRRRICNRKGEAPRPPPPPPSPTTPFCGRDGTQAIARQTSLGLSLDCAVCALMNVTVDDGIDAEVAFGIARELEAKLAARDVASGTKSPVRHFEEGVGNLSGLALVSIGEAFGYSLVRLSREEFGHFGHARALVEQCCRVARQHLCGVVWREASGVAGAAATVGHWVGASHIDDNHNWMKRKWVYKDSMGLLAKEKTTANILSMLDALESNRMEFYVVMNLRSRSPRVSPLDGATNEEAPTEPAEPEATYVDI